MKSLSPEVIKGLIQQGQLRKGDVVVLRAAEDNEELIAAQKLLHKHGERCDLLSRSSCVVLLRLVCCCGLLCQLHGAVHCAAVMYCSALV